MMTFPVFAAVLFVIDFAEKDMRKKCLPRKIANLRLFIWCIYLQLWLKFAELQNGKKIGFYEKIIIKYSHTCL